MKRGRQRPGLKDERHKQAKKRQGERDKYPPEVQIAHLDRLGLTATKERAKLQKKIDNEKN